MRGVADQALDDNIGTVGLEGYAVVIVVDVAVLGNKIVAATGVPAVEILGHIVRGGAGEDVDIADEYVGAVFYQGVPIWGLAQLQSCDRAARLAVRHE